MPELDARIVTAFIDKDGSLNEVKDPDFEHSWNPDTSINEPLTEHYGWTLKDQSNTAHDVVLGPVYPPSIEVCINDPDNKKHHNTLAAYKHELVKIDCGYWGTYNRDFQYNNADKGKPQRNFGLIQGHDVWLCNFRGNGSAGNTKFLPKKDSPADKLFQAIKNLGCDIRIISHALASATPFTADLDDETLYLLLPDLHLPEKLPDPPADGARHPDKDTRKELRNLLRQSQHQDGFVACNPFGEEYQRLVQPYLEGLCKGSTADFKFPSGVLNLSSSSVTSTQFQAEKDVLDRTVRSRSIWFYGPTDDNSETDEPPEDKEDPATIDPSPAVELGILLSNVIALKNASPSVKIQIFQLGDLYELWMGREFLYRNFPVMYDLGAKAFLLLEVLQAPLKGVNDELQYRMGTNWVDDSTIDENFTQAVKNELDSLTSNSPVSNLPATNPVTGKPLPDTGSIAKTVADKLSNNPVTNKVSSVADKVSNNPVASKLANNPVTGSSSSNSNQSNSSPQGPHPCPRYVYHKWSKFRLLHRHYNGWKYFINGSLSDDEIKKDKLTDIVTRVTSLLNERGNAVEAFSLPIPDKCPNIDNLKTSLTSAGMSLDSFISPSDKTQYLWNKIIFDCLTTAGFRNIHGNHDGYRSDPLINGGIGIKAEEWISLPGLWIEHGHRWDEFNRDGNAIGAGVTNLVYYYNEEMIDMDRTSHITHWFPSEQKSVIPGAALWYSLVNIAKNPYPPRGRKDTILPFGIMAVGHTHVPDLVRIQYEQEDSSPPPPTNDDYADILESAK